MTLRLYYSDAYLKEFDARLVRCWSQGERYAAILDQTAFYPTSGGQPHDSGTIQSIPVVDVYEDGNTLVHVLMDSLPQGPVHARIDWARRFDHMQQHTGQHILSQAFLRDAQAQTVSFHLGQSVSTIDLDCTRLDPDRILRVEDTANQVIMENRPIIIRAYGQSEVAQAGLRKPPVVTGTVRVIEVEGFDRCACGGTHLRSTAETGSILIRRWEKRREGTRVEFLCGRRALLDHRRKNSIVRELANGFSVGEWELAEAVDRLRTEAHTCQRALKSLRETALEQEARALLAEAHRHDDLRIAVSIFDGRDPEEVRLLARRLADGQGIAALLGVKGRTGRLFFSRSADVTVDMSELLRDTCSELGSGGGGGSPSLAQGGGLPGGRVDEALALALHKLTHQGEGRR